MNAMAAAVGADVALAALDLLARIMAANAAACRGLAALAGDHACAWAGRTPFGQPQDHEQAMVDALPKTAGAPGVEMVPHRGGGKPGGNSRHGNPPRNSQSSAATIRRQGHLRKRPNGDPGGRVIIEEMRIPLFLITL